MDTVNKEVRSRNMAAIRAKDTKPEILLRSYLHRRGLRFRLHRRNLPGNPDVWFARFRTALFMNGCFWHQHRCCRYATMPKSNMKFWKKKLKSNVERDKKNKRELGKIGVKSVILWECQVRDKGSGRVNRSFLEEVAREIENGEK